MDIPIPDFAVNLGNGLFIDSSGKLTSTIPGEIATFSPSQPLPIPKEAVQNVFGAVGSVVPQLKKIGATFQIENENVFKALGMTPELIEAFGKLGQVVSTVASCIPFVNIAAALVSMFGAFGGSDRIGELIREELGRLRDRMDEDDRDEVDNYIATIRSTFDPAIAAVEKYQIVLLKPKAYLGPDEVKDKRKDAADRIANVHEKLTDALLHSWKLPLKTTDYFDWWNYMQGYLYTIPTSGPPRPAPFPGEEKPFDHRPMVAMLAHGLHVYVTLIKSVIPEHRTTGMYHADLRLAADKLSAQMEKMRSQTLARTIFKAGQPFFRETNRQFYLLTVGAMDLRNDTDDYLRMARNPEDHPEWHRTGNMYNTWTHAPAIPNKGTHVEVDGDDWWTINPKAVELANQQSERDYAALLTRSGYFTLAHLEGLMRHLATEPDRSETVTAKAEVWRKALTATNVPVRNDQIPFSPPIEATASREPQDCKAYITLTTQPIPNDSAIGYRVRLLTLPNGRSETPFETYCWTSYETEGPRNRKLIVHINDGMPLDSVNSDRLLIDSISPATPKQVKRRIKLTADTFDWYLPKPDDPIAFTRIKESVKLGIATGTGTGAGAGATPIPMPPALPGNGTSLSSSRVVTSMDIGIAGTVGWKNEGQEPGGEKRDWKREEVEIDCELYWHEDQMSISLKPQSADRNYVMYLVVEEFLSRSHQFLRTAVRVQFNGQLTYVPQSFFDAEAEAKARANGILKKIERDYSISRRPGPMDPVVAAIRPGFRDTVEGMQDFLRVATQHAPEIVEQVTREAASELANYRRQAATAT